MNWHFYTYLCGPLPFGREAVSVEGGPQVNLSLTAPGMSFGDLGEKGFAGQYSQGLLPIPLGHLYACSTCIHCRWAGKGAGSCSPWVVCYASGFGKDHADSFGCPPPTLPVVACDVHHEIRFLKIDALCLELFRKRLNSSGLWRF